MPKRAILLLEDIDCAFPSREDAEDPDADLPMYSGYPGMVMPAMPRARRSAVTLSGLLNVIDGVGSEEGKLFFATVRLWWNSVGCIDHSSLRRTILNAWTPHSCGPVALTKNSNINSLQKNKQMPCSSVSSPNHTFYKKRTAPLPSQRNGSRI